MARPKQKEKGQKSLDAFVKKKKSKKSDEEIEEEFQLDVDDSSSDADADDGTATAKLDKKSKPDKSSKLDKKSAPGVSKLPPISTIPEIFKDIVVRMPDIKSVAKHIKGRKLRVATMCSGTESPLLALGLSQEYIEEIYDIKLETQHVFSCEIEPFKQAYIERNFKPAILFRDICELGDEEATTAYGSLTKVPGDVDLLIAGTSCVDYSTLNNEKQDIDSNGESGRTFRGMMSWVDKHRPPLVVLENVCGAPWDRVVRYFEKIGYSASFQRIDTKFYYIPHTRTRVYLLAVNKARSDIPQKWKKMVENMQRPASTTLDQWLLPTDDPRIHQARQKLVQESHNALDRRTGRTDWGRCESRHQRARLEEALGSKRPLTSWDDGGYCKLPDFAWSDWGIVQVERVWDLMDISLLRSAKLGVDPSYKTLVWNLSQNVDREIGSKRLGVCPCLTPSMIPYITNRGGPMVGLEALSMQGLPVDKLLLTRETEDQLADLAGNAMSSTVVGTCMLVALIVGKELLKAGDDEATYEEKAGREEAEGSSDEMDVIEQKDSQAAIEARISGEGRLLERPLELSTTGDSSMAVLLTNAERSARLCECEGRTDMTSRELNWCRQCDATACVKCGGRPEHSFEPINFDQNPRVPPSSFARELKSVLPMSMSISGISDKLLEDLRKESIANDDTVKGWKEWKEAVLRAASVEQRFVDLKRQEIWVALFKSPLGALELLLHPKQPEWRFFAYPEEKEPASSEIRKLLEMPVARLRCNNGLFDGAWEFALPKMTSVEISIRGVGERVPAWEALLGLQEEYKDCVVFPQLKIAVPNGSKTLFDRDISGSYNLLDKCGTACSALHRREDNDNEKNLPSLFLFLDPTRTGEYSEDPFVFSTSKRRYQFGETRPIVCRLDPKWRQSSVTEEGKSVKCHIPCAWVKTQGVKLQASASREARFSVPGDVFDVSVSNDDCKSAGALLVCKVPLKEQAGPEWPRGKWVEVDKVHERITFQALAWLIERIKNINDKFDSWTDVPTPGNFGSCHRCAPVVPSIRWIRVDKKIRAIEDAAQAGAYERALKNRPSPFVTQLRLDGKGIGTVQIGINIPSLIHRAYSRLPSTRRPEAPRLSWRLNTNFTDPAKLNLPKFKLKSNRSDPEHKQPPNFIIPLRPEQARSLDWMLRQESLDAEPFVEEEIAEAILDPLGWRVQGRAQRPVRVRGGVLADEVGYGKTAITLALINSSAKSVKSQPKPPQEELKGKIYCRGTLVIVPPHLTRQWASEVKKFTGDHFVIVVISTASAINSLSIEDVIDADIIIVASNLFHSSVYLANLEAFAAGGGIPSQDGRYFNARLDQVYLALREQVGRLRNEGPEAVMEAIHEARKKDEEVDEFIQKKRLKGAKAIAAAEAKDAAKKQAMEVDETYPPPKGLKLEVVVPRVTGSELSSAATPVPSSASSDAETSEAVTDDVSSDSENVGKRLRKRSNAPIIVSDDESEVELLPKGKRSKAARKATSKPKMKRAKKSESSDFEFDGEDSDEDEEADFEESGMESEPAPKKKAVKKVANKPYRPPKKSTKSSDTEMDVDEASSKKAKGRKRKNDAADKDERPSKKQKLREETDPWKLKSKGVKDDWKKMHSPPLEMFYFARMVIDEYTYLEGKILTVVSKLTATRRWVLSGTPPIHDFASLKTIAAFLDIHLGVDDDGEGQSAIVKKRRREQTDVEKFHSFREVHSLEWHAHRHELGQRFLDQFVRQNIAEIDEIPWEEKVEVIDLPAAERAIYLELEHHLRALDMTIKRGRKTESDREKRLAKALGESATAEEALLKRCSHFDLDVTDEENAMKACEVIVKERTNQLEECKRELLAKLEEALKLEKKVGKSAGVSAFAEYAGVCRQQGVGDKESSQMVVELLEEAGVERTSGNSKQLDAKAKVAQQERFRELPSTVKDQIWELREQTHNLRRLTKELVGRVRSLRYFTVVRDLQKQAEEPPSVSCPKCGNQSVPIEDIAVLSSCGHMGCLTCVTSCAEREECVYTESGVCNAAARVLNIVKGSTLGIDDEARDGRGRHFGMKLERVVDLIKRRIPKEERVLVFVQFPDLMKKVAEAFEANHIKFLEIRGSAAMKSKNLEKYQNDSVERVLLLNVTDESASGANLTSANHAVFLSPLLTPTQEIYNACETQAIGRLRRYGQTKMVHIWRFLTSSTIDIEIFEQRTGRKVA